MKALVIFLLVFISSFVNAQTSQEIFKQKKTQKKYLIQQLAALRLYASYLKQGYDIVNKGLNSIKAFKNGEFVLHKDFFNSLKLVNPEIANNGQISEIINWHIAIMKSFQSIAKSNLSSNDGAYFSDVHSKILKECEYNLDELALVISTGQLEMKDDERIKRLDLLYRSMKDKYQFTKAFIAQVKSLNILREQENRNNEASKKLLHITN